MLQYNFVGTPPKFIIAEFRAFFILRGVIFQFDIHHANLQGT